MDPERVQERNEELVRLLHLTARGDQQAFARLYELTSPTLFAVCLRMLVQREWAEEALQEAYVKVWHKAGDYNASRGNVLTWLVSIARYLAIDVRRARARRPEAPLSDDDMGRISDDDAGPMERFLAQDDAAALQRCLGELSDTQRQTITLAFFQGLTHHELSSRLKRPLGTVKSWIRRGLEGLKQCLQG